MPSDDHHCANCNQRFGAHRWGDSRCPPCGTFPEWPKAIRDEARAGLVFDRRVSEFWGASTTVFKPR